MRVIVQTAILLAITSFSLFTGTIEAADDFGPIGVIDVAFIFKNDPGIRSQVEAVENELKQIDIDLKARRTELQNAILMLNEIKPDAAEYAAQEEKVASMQSKLRLDMGRKKKELADSEAQIYYDNYQRIVEGVTKIAEHYKLKIVLRYNSDKMEEGVGESVVRGVMKNVVYHDAGIDMTQATMNYLSQIARR